MLLLVRYLPRFTMRDDRYRDITVRMTLNHTSGLPGSNYRNAISHGWHGVDVIEENYEQFACSKLKANPGTSSIYCNDGFDLAAAIVQEISGQSYISFLRDYVTTPAGARSTGAADIAIGERRMMSCVGKKPEWLTAMGAGAIRTDLSDCARFGYLWIDPGSVLSRRARDEMCKPQGATFLKRDDYSRFYGLGWDTVSFRHLKVDLGRNVLKKSGGTTQFDSELVVSTEYQLSAAISATSDCEAAPLHLLCELIEITLQERGAQIESKAEPARNAAGPLQPVPQQLMTKHEAVYYANQNDCTHKLDINEERLVVLHYAGNGEWKPDPWYPEMRRDGEKFYSDKVSVVFEDTGDQEYFIMMRDNKYFNPLAQRNTNYPPMSSGWNKRIGRKYLACNISAFDVDSSLTETAVYIDIASDDGVILFIMPNDDRIIPVVSCGNDDTEMFLNIPHDGAEDIYAPFISRDYRKEYLRITGYIYIDTETIPLLSTGTVKSHKKEDNVLYRTKSGTTVQFSKPEDVAVILFNDKLSVVYTSHDNKPLPQELIDGYIIFANDGPMDFDITVI